MEDSRINHVTFGVPEPMSDQEKDGRCFVSAHQTHCECWWDGEGRCCFCNKGESAEVLPDVIEPDFNEDDQVSTPTAL